MITLGPARNAPMLAILFANVLEVNINIFLAAPFFTSACAGFSERTESMRIIHQQAELIFLRSAYFLQFTLVSGHTKYTLCNNEYATTALLLNQFGGPLHLFFKVFDIVMLEHIPVSGMQA